MALLSDLFAEDGTPKPEAVRAAARAGEPRRGPKVLTIPHAGARPQLEVAPLEESSAIPPPALPRIETPAGFFDGATLMQPADEQVHALALCRRERFANLSGTAGVGKTYVAKQLAADPGTVLAATTGIAAVNLGEGTTINALLKYFDTASLQQAFLGGFLQMQLRKLRRCGLRRIVLDEKSMLNGTQLTHLVRALDEVNASEEYDASLEAAQAEELELPPQTSVGGRLLSLVLVGDFGQLPPVPDTDPITQRKLPVSFAFESPEWERFAAATATLTTIHRQTDRAFIEALQAVRRGDKASALQFFSGDRFTQQIDDAFDGTTIFAKNDAVERYNQLRLDKLSTPVMTYETVRTGKPRPDWKLIPDTLTLKEGALVMLLANRRIYDGPDDEEGELLYANGDLGHLQRIAEAGWGVTLIRTGGVVAVLPITRENLIPLEPGRRKEIVALHGPEGAKAFIDKSSRSEIIGTVSYMPLRCAYGCTVHKTQGLSLDRVQINIRDPFFRQPGMLYVALSRARTAEGLRIVGTPAGAAERMTVEKKVQRWL